MPIIYKINKFLQEINIATLENIKTLHLPIKSCFHNLQGINGLKNLI